ncbi:endo-1,4-beta-xylanase [Spirochaetia bacterium 38H-sp]|uniref:Beta-xylanase n=1 Tax=Rarispira pelagica TaxID=3141764 RepID=A0ABU9UDC1_9SPIR
MSKKYFYIFVCIVFVLVSGCKSDAGGQPDFDMTDYRPMAQVYKDYFYIGAAVKLGEYDSTPFYDAYPASVLESFNSFSAENGMKPDNVYSSDGSFDFTYGDRLVKYASEHGAVVRGHTLVWHYQSDNVFKEKRSKEEAREFLQKYIDTVVGHFRGKIYAWDVVNEAVGDGGQWRTDSPWYRYYGGPEYIRDAFVFAQKADPDALHFYNDYNMVNSTKRARVIKMIKDLDLISAGLDGIGIQAHWNLYWPSAAEIEKAIKAFADMGLLIHITELDIDCYNGNPSMGEIKYTSSLEKQLADRYAEIFSVFRKYSQYIDSVTFWGIGDEDSWLNYYSGGRFFDSPRNNYPLLFDRDNKPKKAFFAASAF